MIEEWRPVVGYEGLYEVSNTGRVRSLDRFYYRLHKGKVLSPAKDRYGYLTVTLNYNGKSKTIKIHRLVAQAFIENPDNLPQVNNIDEDKSNNSVENLEWCTAKYNNKYGTRLERFINTKIKNGYVNEENVGLSKKEYEKKRYQENKDKRKDSQRKYYQKNKDRICERQKEYSQKNKEKIREYHHQYYLKKKEENIQNNVKSLND